jgi:P27 family predicted phage terminase small subunit
MRGRKPTPTVLKVIQGNPGNRPLNANEPEPRAAMPTCPSHLCPPAKAEWKRVASEMKDLGMLSRLDRSVLAGYCQGYGRWVEAERKLSEMPMLLKMPSGYIQQNPWLTIANKQLELMLKFGAELGLSPSTRSRVSVTRSERRPWLPSDEYLRS